MPGNILASGSTALDHCAILSFVPFIVHHCTIVRIYIYIERERINNTWVCGNTRFISSVEHDISQVSAANEKELDEKVCGKLKFEAILGKFIFGCGSTD